MFFFFLATPGVSESYVVDICHIEVSKIKTEKINEEARLHLLKKAHLNHRNPQVHLIIVYSLQQYW